MSVRLPQAVLAGSLIFALTVPADGRKKPKVRTYGKYYPNTRKVHYRYYAYTKNGRKYKHGPETVYYRNGKGRVQKKTMWKYGVRHGRYVEFFNADEVKVKTKGEYERGRKTGLWQEWFPNLQKHREATFAAGKLHGPYREWSANGQELDRKTYKAGKKHGAELTWYPDGTRRSRTNYENDVRSGLEQTWHANGKQRSHTEYVNGKRNGVERLWNEDGVLLSETQYRAGVRHGRERLWFTNGKPKSETDYVENVRHGLEKIYYEGGNLKSEGRYEQNVAAGVHVSYFANGKKRSETSYVKGKREGASRNWFANGELSTLYTFRMNKLHGDFEIHNLAGKLLAKGTYQNGRPFSGTFLNYTDSDRAYFVAIYKAGERQNEIFYVDNRPYTGVWETFFDFDRKDKRSRTTYKDGRRHGPETLWHENGKKFFELNWTEGELDGNLTQWHTSGKKAWEVQFVRGRHHGFEKAWDVHGEPLCAGEWRNGKPWNDTVIIAVEKGDGQAIQQYKNGKLIPGIPKAIVRNIKPVRARYEQTIEHQKGKRPRRRR